MKRLLFVFVAFVLAFVGFQTKAFAAPTGSVFCDSKDNVVVSWAGGSGGEGSVRIDYSGSTVFFSSASGSYIVGPGTFVITLRIGEATVINAQTKTCPDAQEEEEKSETSIPDGFVLRTIVCTVGVYDEPAEDLIPGEKLLQGQTWYIYPFPVKGSDGKAWTEVFIAGDITVFIPTSCVGAAPAR